MGGGGNLGMGEELTEGFTRSKHCFGNSEQGGVKYFMRLFEKVYSADVFL